MSWSHGTSNGEGTHFIGLQKDGFGCGGSLKSVGPATQEQMVAWEFAKWMLSFVQWISMQIVVKRADEIMC